MKMVINGKVYNTETATKISSGGRSGRASVDDFSSCSESLYRSRKGQYFLAGFGGARSKYARSAGQNGSTGGEGIILLSDTEALKWAEQHMTAEESEAAFTVEEG